MNQRMSELLLAVKGNFWAARQFPKGSDSYQYYLGQARAAKEELNNLLSTVG